MLRLVGKQIFTILHSNFLLSKPVVFTGHLCDKYPSLVLAQIVTQIMKNTKTLEYEGQKYV